MIITLDSANQATTYKGKTGADAVTQAMSDINTAIGQRVAQTNSFVDLGPSKLFGTLGNQSWLSGEANTQAIKAITFSFKANDGLRSGDDAGLYPLQGVALLMNNNDTTVMGQQNSAQSVQMSLDGFAEISTVTSYHIIDSKHEVRYGVRVAALYVEGKKQNGQNLEASNLLILPAVSGGITGKNIDEFRTSVENYNKKGGRFAIMPVSTVLNMKLAAANPAVSLINVAAHLFEGASHSYVDGLSLRAGFPVADPIFDPASVKKLIVALDFEPITWGNPDAGDTGSYEISFQSTAGSRDLKIAQTDKSRTLSIPSISASVYQGPSATVGSPASWTKSSMDRTEAETTKGNQANEKFVLKLPPHYYRLVNFTATDTAAVEATVSLYGDGGVLIARLFVPLGKKFIFAPDDWTVAQSVIACI